MNRRRLERGLLYVVFLFMLLGLIILKYSFEEVTNKAFFQGIIISLFFLALNIILSVLKHKGDQYLLPISAMLSGIGLTFIYRLTPGFAERQFLWLMVGSVSFLAVIWLVKDYRRLGDFKYIYMLIGISALVATIVFGTKVSGSTNWITIGSFRFQPAEVVKLFLVLFLASYLVDKKELLVKARLDSLGPLLAMWGLSILFLISQKDLGTALLFFGTFLAMLFIATARRRYLLGGSILFLLGSFSAYKIFNHVKIRFDIWVNPWTDIDGRGYQIAQSLFALGSGGIFGTGIGLGQPQVIPAVHTDFIFSAIAEEMGLLGGVAVIILYLMLISRGFRIALRAKSEFGSMLAAGLTSLLAIQTFIILAGVTKLMPLTGITLPFISYGGSSLLANFILIGLLMNISHHEEEEYEKQYS